MRARNRFRRHQTGKYTSFSHFCAFVFTESKVVALLPIYIYTYTQVSFFTSWQKVAAAHHNLALPVGGARTHTFSVAFLSIIPSRSQMERKSLQMRAEKLNSDGPSTPPVFTFFRSDPTKVSQFVCLAGVSLALFARHEDGIQC